MNTLNTGPNLDRLYTKDSSVVFRKVAEEFILVPIKKRADEVDSIYTMNEVGSRIWELVDGEKSLSEIIDIILNEFEVSPEVAEKDIIEFINQLEHIGAIRAL
ncbi:MAG: PqqD family protein [Nitrospirae bacterium]|nr:PqqD family protein [Nitrospirota bacterium]